MACLKFTPKRLTKEYCQCWTMSLIHYPLGTNWVLELVGTWLRQGQGCFGTKGLGPGLDNYSLRIIISKLFLILSEHKELCALINPKIKK